MEPGAEGTRFITIIPPAGIEMKYTGIFYDGEIKPAGIGATWHPALPSDKARLESRIMLHFHGGSFLWGTGHDSDSEFTGQSLASQLGGYALLVQYRLVTAPETCFPAAFQDALTAYLHLIDTGIKPENIIISGDSAGALLAIGLVRYLNSPGSNLLLPRACLLFSPSVDLTVQGNAKAIDTHKNYRTDLLSGSTLSWGVSAFLPSQRRDTPYLAPARYPFKSSTPIWIQSGTNEVLIDTYKMFVNGMKGIDGNQVEFYEVPHAPHDIIFVGHIIGWQEAVKSALAAAKAFID